jgi:crotonobetainyl-CoA:carnitine CoA-transferase CaiB-like acyl-CoA transferase
MSATPLTGLKVFEFSHTVMGPTAGLVFAELGADVVRWSRRRAATTQGG